MPSHGLLVPEGTRLLHIGSTKTGGTSLQLAMYDARETMLEHGVRLVGGDRAGRAAVKAALRGQLDDAPPSRQLQTWRNVVEEIPNADDPRVCLSNGSLCEIEQDRARMMVDALGDHPDDPWWQHFWTPHDIEGLVDRWVSVTAPDRFILVIADVDDRLALSRSFERLLGLPDGMLAPQESQRTNESASIQRVEAVRLLNERLANRPWPEWIKSELRSRVAKRIRTAVSAWPGETRIPPMPSWAADRVRELGEQREKLVRSLGVTVIGDPAHLRSSVAGESGSSAGTRDSPYTVSAELAAEMVVTAVGGAVDLIRERARRDRRQIARRGKGSGSQRTGGGLDSVSGRELARELVRRIGRRLSSR